MINAAFVEKALIGALLNDPSNRQHIPWLDVGDFTHPLCRALWQHLQNGWQPDISSPIDYADLAHAIQVETGLHPRTTAPSQIAAIHIHAPANPNAAAYGRILVEVNIRDQMARIGLRIGTSHTPGTRAEMATVGRLTQRWTTVTTTPSRTTTRLTSTLEDASQRIRSAGILVLRADVEADLDLAERVVIGSVIHDLPHGSRDAIFTTLEADEFSLRQTAPRFRPPAASGGNAITSTRSPSRGNSRAPRRVSGPAFRCRS